MISHSLQAKGYLNKEVAVHKGETFKDVLHQIANHFIITAGRAFSSAAAYLGIISFLAPVDWLLAKVVIGASVAWWTWTQSKDYFIERSPLRDPQLEEGIKNENLEVANNKEHHKRSLDEIYFVGPKKYLNQFFKVLSVVIFFAICLTAFYPPLLPVLGPASILAHALGLGGTFSSIPYLAAAMSAVAYISQSFFYGFGRLALFGYDKLLTALGKQSSPATSVSKEDTTNKIFQKMKIERRPSVTNTQSHTELSARNETEPSSNNEATVGRMPSVQQLPPPQPRV